MCGSSVWGEVFCGEEGAGWVVAEVVFAVVAGREEESGGGETGATPKGRARCSMARVKGALGRRASLGQRVRRRV